MKVYISQNYLEIYGYVMKHWAMTFFHKICKKKAEYTISVINLELELRCSLIYKHSSFQE